MLVGGTPVADTTLISVRVPKDVAKRLRALAKATDRSKSYVAGQAIEEFLTLQEWQVKAIRQGIAEANAGKLIPHDEAVKRLRRWGRRGT
jgi:RHH-type transcriptional regulator, rel operon repressor / antitoxin RelB